MSIKVLNADGSQKIKVLKVNTNASYMFANGVGAHFDINIGAEYARMKSMIAVSMDANTPYNQITNVVGGSVSTDGHLQAEVYGTGLLPAHLYAFNILLFDQ